MKLILTVHLFLGGTTMAAQTRAIVPEQVYEARKPARAPSKQAAKPNYTAAPDQQAGVAALRPESAVRQVGVTIWRLRPAATGNSGVRILVQEESQTSEFVPERVASTSILKPGERLRLSIETPNSGYLYVIDRERYQNGDRGEPYLIFPTSKTHSGQNYVNGGQLIDIPAQTDRPNYFLLRPSRSDQSEEELTVLLTPKPIEGLSLGEKALRLSQSQVAAWEKQWGARETARFELSGGAGRTWTRAEQEAAAGGATRLLTQEDPPPQTVYRVAAGPDDPVLVKVRLRYR